MKTVIFRIISAILLIATMIFVFNLSGQDAQESAELSGGVTFALFSLFYKGFAEATKSQQLAIILEYSFIIRKTAHFLIYFGMGVFSYLTFVSYTKLKFYLRQIIAFAVCFLFAVSDEIHQSFIGGRSCEARDVLIDGLGAAVSILILSAFCLCIKKIRKKLI
ncbi:MAG: VanZ family protein [Clostridia bacterium]|nr:VanZ family protein [Clostridia bacterium]